MSICERGWGLAGKRRGWASASPPSWTRALAPKAAQEASVGLVPVVPGSCTDLAHSGVPSNSAAALAVWELLLKMCRWHT